MDTFCIHPWTRLRVEPGAAGVCCAFRGDKISKDGAPMLPTQHSIGEIWNCDEMRGIRRDMVEGRKVAGCEECYQNEASGGTSMRVRDNKTWEDGWLNDERTSIEQLKSVAAENDFRLPSLPVSLEVDTGSLCNLKCRMCHGAVSSRIARDPVHATWALDAFAGTPYHNEATAPWSPPIVRFPKQSFINDVASYVEKVRRIYLIGGEPTLVKEIRGVLQQLVDSGHAPRIELALVSNGSVTSSWLDLTRHFSKLQLAVSIDGFARHYEYIRYPYRWESLVRNLETFKAMPHVNLGGAVTLQANNMLNITELFRFLDAAGIGFYCYPIYMPRHLSIWAMPAEIRRLASERLRDYGERDCLPQHRDMVLGLANQTAPGVEHCDPALLRQFMMFTNDLDASRGQSIKHADPELTAALERAGFPWIDTVLHAGQRFPNATA